MLAADGFNVDGPAFISLCVTVLTTLIWSGVAFMGVCHWSKEW